MVILYEINLQGLMTKLKFKKPRLEIDDAAIYTVGINKTPSYSKDQPNLTLHNLRSYWE